MLARDSGASPLLGERYLADALNTVEDAGAYLADAPRVLEQVGMGGGAFREGLQIGDLAAGTTGGRSAIASVRMAGGGLHALVVDAVDAGSVFIRDPLPGRTGSAYSVSAEDFMQAWTGKAVTFP